MNEALAVLAFHQVYDPVGGNIALSALIAGVPLYILFIMLAVLRLPAWISALVAMLSAAVLAALVWGMPVGLDASATTAGMANGLWPISWIVLNAGCAAPHAPVTLPLSAMVVPHLPVFSIIIPACFIVVLAGWRRMLEVLPAVLAAAVVFALVPFLVPHFIGPDLTDVLAALVS